MMKQLNSWLLLICLCNLIPATAQRSNLATEKKLIEDVRERWTKCLQNKQLEKSMDLYDNNAVFYNPDGSKASGRPAISRLYQTVMKQFDSHLQFISAGISIEGNIGYDSGDYKEELVNRATHQKINARGSYLMTLQKQNSGWKITRLMWTSLPN